MPRVFLILAILTAQATACLWDRDTLAEEAKGRGDLVKIIVGWFDRYPPRYYEMRLERVTEELAANPNNLELLDDAAVACDRLGRPDEAIGWMEKKKAILDGLPADASPEHHYRYLANLGTFYVHRWVSKREAERNADLSDLRTGEKLIAQAIKENPEAHFGREVYQLIAIRWLLRNENVDSDQDQSTGEPIYFDEDSGLMSTPTTWIKGEDFIPVETDLNQAHIEGIAGLIQLGAAWQSADAFRSLGTVLDANGLASLAELAFLRGAEIAANGKLTLHPSAAIQDKITPSRSQFLSAQLQGRVRAYFPEARAAADSRHAMWVAYQEERFAKDLHPDTHPDFWNAWSEPDFPNPPGPTIGDRVKKLANDRFGLVASIIIVSFAIVVLVIIDFFRRRKLRADYQSSPQ